MASTRDIRRRIKSVKNTRQITKAMELVAASKMKKAQLDRGARIVELFKQPAFNPLPIELQVAVLWAMQKNYFDPIDTKKVVAASTSMKDFFTARKDALLTKIRTKAALDAELEAELKTACNEWKSTFTA